MTHIEHIKIKAFGDALCKRWGVLLSNDPDPAADVGAKAALSGALQLLQELDLISDYGVRGGVVMHPLSNKLEVFGAPTRARVEGIFLGQDTALAEALPAVGNVVTIQAFRARKQAQ